MITANKSAVNFKKKTVFGTSDRLRIIKRDYRSLDMGKLVICDDDGNQIDLVSSASLDNIITDAPAEEANRHIGTSAEFSMKMSEMDYYKLTWAAWGETIIRDMLMPKGIYHNRKTAETIVLWKDGTKTVVKPMKGTPESDMSSYSAFTAALAKKIYGTNTQVNKVVSMTEEPVTKAEKQHRRKLAEKARHLLNITSNLKEKEDLEHIIDSMGDEG